MSQKGVLSPRRKLTKNRNYSLKKIKYPAVYPILRNVELSQASNIYLSQATGLILDTKLSWKQIDKLKEIIKNARIADFAFTRIIGTEASHFLLDIHAILRPVLTYGILVWWKTLEKKTYCTMPDSYNR